MGMFKGSLFVLVSVASAQNVVVAPASSYGAAPVAVEPVAPPQPYAYEYGVADDYSNSNFKKAETQAANGFVAEVSYEGTPVYPPEPAEGYGYKPTLVKAAPIVAAPVPAAPVYKAAPAVAAPVPASANN